MPTKLVKSRVPCVVGVRVFADVHLSFRLYFLIVL